MKKILKIILVTLLSVVAMFVLIIGGYVVYLKYIRGNVEATYYYADELKIDKGTFKSEFEEIHAKVKDNYSLYESKHLDMDSLHDVFAKRIETEVKSSADFGLLLKEYFAALNAGHAKICLDSYGAARSLDYFTPQYIEGRLFVSHPTDYLTQNGFKDKDEIVAINGIPTSLWIAQEEKYTSASTEAYRKMRTAECAFESWADTVRTYAIKREGKEIMITLPLKKYDFFAKRKKPNYANSKVINGNVGYIEITSMMEGATEDFVKAFDKVKQLPYLIIDVRRNGGGSSGEGRRICEYLVRKPQPHCLSYNIEITPKPDAYKGKIYLLTSNYTFSAAESFVIDMKESGNATLVGEATGGDTGNNPQTFKTSNNIYFVVPTNEPALSPKGFPLEGKGVEPHYKVHQTVSDFQKNVDTVLEAVLKLIK